MLMCNSDLHLICRFSIHTSLFFVEYFSRFIGLVRLKVISDAQKMYKVGSSLTLARLNVISNNFRSFGSVR